MKFGALERKWACKGTIALKVLRLVVSIFTLTLSLVFVCRCLLPVACWLPLPLLFHLSGEGGNWSLERSLPTGDYFKLSCIWVLLLWLPSRIVLVMKNLHTDTLLNLSAQNNTKTSYN